MNKTTPQAVAAIGDVFAEDASAALPRSWIETFTDARLVVRRPKASRVSNACVTLFIVILACTCVVLAGRSGGKDIAAIFVFTPMAVLFAIVSVLMVPQFSPLRLDCDLRQGTYRFHYAAPAPTTVTGPLSAFADVFTDSYKMRDENRTYRVLLRWKTAPKIFGRPSPTIVAYETFDESESNGVARLLSEKLNLPLRS